MTILNREIEILCPTYTRPRTALYFQLLMANLIRSAKDSYDWTQNELAAYNTTIVTQNKQKFFGSADLPVPVIPSLAGFMTSKDREHAVDGETRKFLHHLDLALGPLDHEAAVSNFAAQLLEKLGYDDRDDDDRIIYIAHTLPLVICGISREAATQVCVMGDDSEVLLLLLGKLTFGGPRA